MKTFHMMWRGLFIVLLWSGLSRGDDLPRFNQLIRRYSSQHIVTLDVNQDYLFQLKDGTTRTIRLENVKEYRDSVVKLVRSADVDISVDGNPVRLQCVPFGMPTEFNGIRVQADTTSNWLGLPKRVQLSIWDVTDPIVNTDHFVFPLDRYDLFSHGMQGYNEVVHLGWVDGCPKGAVFYHNYGVDFAGYEGKQEILCCTDGKVIAISSGENNFVVVEDSVGLIWKYGHLDSIYEIIKQEVSITKGTPIGLLGKTGPSGNFAHLHVGTFLSEEDFISQNNNCRFNLYPWLVAASHHQHRRHVYAVARPHRTASTGELIHFDGHNSMVLDADKASYKWILPDGRMIQNVIADGKFDQPGIYIAELWIKDRHGHEDVDFCTVKVFTQSQPEDTIPTLFMTSYPAKDIRLQDPVCFQIWLQGAEGIPITLDFGDGRVIDNYESYTEVIHRFTSPGIHIVTSTSRVDGIPIMQKHKVIVAPR